jgi:hypothetical protein
MIEKVGYVRNPLTVIAMFAALAEVSGTVVLPFLKPDTQQTYMWFLMGFPCLLVALFFVTLLRKHHVLYAPSDFRSDESFTKIFTSVSGTSRVYKLEEEAKEVEAIEKGQQQIGQYGEPTTALPTKRDIRATALLAEELVIATLGGEWGVNFDRNVAFHLKPNLIFDAVALTPERILVVEVKYNRSGVFGREFLESIFTRFNTVYQTLSPMIKRKFEVILAVATDREGVQRHDEIKAEISGVAQSYPFKTTIRIFDLKVLESNLEQETRLLSGEGIDHLSRRIVGLLGSGKSMNLQELLSELGVESGNHAAVADVQTAIGDLVLNGRIEHHTGSIDRYKLKQAK